MATATTTTTQTEIANLKAAYKAAYKAGNANEGKALYEAYKALRDANAVKYPEPKYSAKNVKQLDYDLACEMIKAGIKPKAFGPKSQLAKSFSVSVNKRGDYVAIYGHGEQWVDCGGDIFGQMYSLTPATTTTEVLDAVVNGAFAQITIIVDWVKHCE